MTRFVYRLLLLLHPRAFAKHFGAEMLWIFDQQPSARLIGDAAVSLCRQWIMRTHLWIFVAAIGGAALTMSVGLRVRAPVPNQLHATKPDSPEEMFFLLIVLSLFAVAIAAIGCVAWFQIARRLRRA